MVEDLRAGRFDLLLTGYSDHWQRNLRRTLELLEDELHPNGVALVMCDRKILSSDPSEISSSQSDGGCTSPPRPPVIRPGGCHRCRWL
jgi:hypothetical protein